MFDATSIKFEEQIQYLMQQVSNSKNKYNVWCNTYQTRRANTIFDATNIKLEEQIQCLMEHVSNSKNKKKLTQIET